ncbi:MAG: hypothetical protein DRH21_01960 [Deltaproteobacteria bacterium]|nr:MAG: hypothetical protein DRH21_01960 [Deltaproteobacteria bacterium]
MKMVYLAWSSLKNKFTFSGVEAHAWQGARRANSKSYLTNEQRSHAGWIGASKCEVIFERALRYKYKNIKWFFIDHVCFLWYSL